MLNFSDSYSEPYPNSREEDPDRTKSDLEMELICYSNQSDERKENEEVCTRNTDSIQANVDCLASSPITSTSPQPEP